MREMATASPTTASSSSFLAAVEEREWALLHLLKASLIAFLPGAAQGATTVLLGHPLDTAKVRMQAAGPNVTKSTFGTMWTMASTEGVRSLYRGVIPPLIMEGAKRSLQFALWDWLRACNATAAAAAAAEAGRSNDDTGDGDAGPAAAHGSSTAAVRDCRRQTLAYIGGNTFLSGALAGGVGTLIGCPMHVIKIQTQYQTARDTRNAWTCMKDIYKKDGVVGYYRGFRYNLLKDVCFAGTYLGLYATFRDRAWFQPTSGDCPASATAGAPRTSHLGAFVSGATASMATWVVLYPLDTVKTLVQARQAHAIPAILHHPARLYRGLVASLLKAGPVSGVAMAVYEQMWSVMNKAA